MEPERRLLTDADFLVAILRIAKTPRINRALGNQEGMLTAARTLSAAGFRRVNHPHPLSPLDGNLDVEGNAAILHVPSH